MADMREVAELSTPKAKPVNQRIGRNVRDIMWLRGITVTELAHRIGVQQSSMSRRIRGTTDWTPDEIDAAARILDVSVARLWKKLPDLDSNQEPAGYKPGAVLSLAAARRAAGHAGAA